MYGLTSSVQYRKVQLFGNTWVGGTDMADEGDWRWANGTRFNWTTALGITQPPADGSKNCLVATTSQSFDHRSCDDRYPIICEMESGKFEPLL